MRHLHPKKIVRTPDLIATVTAAIKEDCHISIETIADAMGYPKKTFSTFCNRI
jgi:hypothetical protein